MELLERFAAGDLEALSLQLKPDLPSPVDGAVLLPDALDLFP